MAALGDEADAKPRDPIGRQEVDWPAVEKNRAGADRDEAEDRLHRRRFAHAVAPEQGCDLARADVERQAEEHLARAIGGLEPAHRQHIQSASSPR